MKKMLLAAVVGALLSGLILGGCAKPSAAPAPSAPAPAPEQSLSIGVASPLTGTMAFLGTEITNGISLAIDDQNAKGGVTIGGQKYVIKPILQDTKADLVVAKSIAEDLIYNKKVKIIAGPFMGDAVGIQAVTEPNKVLGFFVTVLLPTMVGPNKPYSFFCVFPFPQMIYKCLYYIQKKYPQAKTVLSLEGDTPDAPTFVSATQSACALLNYNYLGFEKVSLDTTDFTPVIARILPKKPDIIDTGNIGGVMGGLDAALIKQIRQAGFNGIIFIPAAPPEEMMEQTVPAQSLKDVVSQYIDVNGPVVDPKYRDVLVRFQAKYKMVGVDVINSFYNVMMAMFEFLDTQNTMDTTVWMQGFAKYRWQGIMGFESFWIGEVGDGINRRMLGNNWVTHYENGKPITDFTAPIPWSLFTQ